jgi:hypothetical protein
MLHYLVTALAQMFAVWNKTCSSHQVWGSRKFDLWPVVKKVHFWLQIISKWYVSTQLRWHFEKYAHLPILSPHKAVDAQNTSFGVFFDP